MYFDDELQKEGREGVMGEFKNRSIKLPLHFFPRILEASKFDSTNPVCWLHEFPMLIFVSR